MSFCVICLQLLLIIATEGYSVRSPDYGNAVIEIESIIESLVNAANDNEHERHERITPESHENNHTNKGRGHRTKRDDATFKEHFMKLWNAFIEWLKKSWKSIAEFFKKLKF